MMSSGKYPSFALMTCHKHPHAHLVTVDDLAVDASGGRRCLWEDGNKALRAKFFKHASKHASTQEERGKRKEERGGG